MHKNIIRCTCVGLVILSFCFANVFVYSHSGRTDANGGHRDNKNKSGLGSYHYHCGGYPAHLHDGGKCPYKSSNSNVTEEIEKVSPVTSTPTTNNTITYYKEEVPKEVMASDIKINQNPKEMEVGREYNLTATIEPDNTSNKKIIWSTNDSRILKVDKNGKVTASAAGLAKITATTGDGIKDTIEIIVKESDKPKVTKSQERTSTNNSDLSSNFIETFFGFCVLGGIGAIVYGIYMKMK